MIVFTKNGRITAEERGITLGQFFKEKNGIYDGYMFWPSVQKPNWTSTELREIAEHLDRMNQGELPNELGGS